MLGFAIALPLGCSSSDKPPPQSGTSGSAGQTGVAGAGAGTHSTSGAAGSAGSGGSGGKAGSASGGSPPGGTLEDCTGLPDGSICDPASGFVSVSSAFCVREECHRTIDFVVTCWNRTPTCIEGESYGVFDYTLTLAGEEMCPAGATCTTESIANGQFPWVLIDCGRVTPFDCDASELSSGAESTPGVHQGKVRCRGFTLDETYCLPPYTGEGGAGGSGD
jgi:hypothetical protein